MAKQHPNNQTGADQPADSTLNSAIWHESFGDRDYIPNEGYLFSRSRRTDYERAARKFAGQNHNDRMLISENEILEMANEINKSRAMRQVAQERQANHCYPGTDTIDPTKNPNSLHSQPNHFELDRSKSTILISVVQSNGCWLNGSTVPHRHYIHITLETPDGRHYGEIALTFEQFASAMVSNSPTPCTWHAFWSAEPTNVLLKEVVKQPDTLVERAQQRAEGMMAEAKNKFDRLLGKLEETMAEGKGLSKTKLRDLVNDLDNHRHLLDSNQQFVVTQVKEEATAIVEQAAITLAFTHLLDKAELHPQAQVLVGTKPLIEDKHG